MTSVVLKQCAVCEARNRISTARIFYRSGWMSLYADDSRALVQWQDGPVTEVLIQSDENSVRLDGLAWNGMASSCALANPISDTRITS